MSKLEITCKKYVIAQYYGDKSQLNEAAKTLSRMPFQVFRIPFIMRQINRELRIAKAENALSKLIYQYTQEIENSRTGGK